jgi:aspartyl protease family protein
LREVKIGDMVLENVEALVIDNVNAPLLLGQTVLERFGSIEIDNVNGEIIFK